jgi:hypothetical protein
MRKHPILLFKCFQEKVSRLARDDPYSSKVGSSKKMTQSQSSIQHSRQVSNQGSHSCMAISSDAKHYDTIQPYSEIN